MASWGSINQFLLSITCPGGGKCFATTIVLCPGYFLLSTTRQVNTSLFECPRSTTRALLPGQDHLLLTAVIDLQSGWGHGVGCSSNNYCLAFTSSVGEELFLQVLGYVLFDDNVVGVVLYQGLVSRQYTICLFIWY
jgi:hypothetical protein